MDIKDIVNKTMDKLINHINNFHKDITVPNLFNINKKILDAELDKAQTKYNDYVKDTDIRQNVNNFITNIYNKKKDTTIKNYIISEPTEGF